MSETVPQAEGRLRAAELAEELRDMKFMDRGQFIEAFLTELRSLFCLHCGSDDLPCHCENDE